MPHFRYSFSDARGQMLEGTLVAADEAEARVILNHRGYPNAMLIGDAVGASPSQVSSFRSQPAAAPPILASTPPIVAAPAPHQRAATPRSTGTVRTKKGSDKQRFFLFAQFSRLLNAGINPARAFDEVGRVTPYEHYKRSFQELSDDATDGRPLSATMARYPDLYPDHVIGMIRAAEAGGFVPEAFMMLSNHAEEAHKFKRFHWFLWYAIPRALVALPLAFAFGDSIRKAATEGRGDLVNIFMGFVVWPYGPIMLGIAAAMLLVRWWMGTLPMRHARHRIGLRAPVFGARARNESISLFTWTLSRLSKSGVPPNSSWQMALAAVPNLEMQARLRDAGARMHSGSRLSEAVFGTKLFPDEYAPIISTGELTGDLPGALDQLERVSRTEYDETTKKAKWTSMRIGCVFMILTSGVMLLIIVKAWYHDVIKIFAPEAFEQISSR
jgi:type IV pilus assembly protein PilC